MRTGQGQAHQRPLVPSERTGHPSVSTFLCLPPSSKHRHQRTRFHGGETKADRQFDLRGAPTAVPSPMAPGRGPAGLSLTAPSTFRGRVRHPNQRRVKQRQRTRASRHSAGHRQDSSTEAPARRGRRLTVSVPPPGASPGPLPSARLLRGRPWGGEPRAGQERVGWRLDPRPDTRHPSSSNVAQSLLSSPKRRGYNLAL